MSDLVDKSTMVTNAKLAKEVTKEKERNGLIEEALEEMKTMLEEVIEAAKNKDEEGGSSEKGKEKFDEEDIIPKPYPPLE